MSSKIWLINLVLAAVVMFFGLKAYEVWSGEKKRPSEPGSLKSPLPWPEKKVARRSVSPESDYAVIVSNNLFSNSRSMTETQEQKNKQPAAKIKADGSVLRMLEWSYNNTNLYGVVIVGDHREAFIGEVPAGTGTSVGERGIKRAKVGDTVGRFKVKEINATSVLLTAGGHEWRVALFDKDKPKKRVPIKKETGPIVVGAESKTGVGATSDRTKEQKLAPKPTVSKNKERMFPVTNKSGSDKR